MVLFKAPYKWPEINGYNWSEIHPSYFFTFLILPGSLTVRPQKEETRYPERKGSSSIHHFT